MRPWLDVETGLTTVQHRAMTPPLRCSKWGGALEGRVMRVMSNYRASAPEVMRHPVVPCPQTNAGRSITMPWHHGARGSWLLRSGLQNPAGWTHHLGICKGPSADRCLFSYTDHRIITAVGAPASIGSVLVPTGRRPLWHGGGRSPYLYHGASTADGTACHRPTCQWNSRQRCFQTPQRGDRCEPGQRWSAGPRCGAQCPEDTGPYHPSRAGAMSVPTADFGAVITHTAKGAISGQRAQSLTRQTAAPLTHAAGATGASAIPPCADRRCTRCPGANWSGIARVCQRMGPSRAVRRTGSPAANPCALACGRRHSFTALVPRGHAAVVHRCAVRSECPCSAACPHGFHAAAGTRLPRRPACSMAGSPAHARH